MTVSPFLSIDQHQTFIRVGRAFTTMAAAVSDLDLPDTLSLPQNRPTLLVGNHRSLFDLVATMVIFTKFNISSRIQVRADLMESGPGARFLHGIGCIPTSTEKRESAERISIETIEKGHLLSMMPEGRLCKPSEWVRGVGPLRPGVSRIALATGAVVVPVGFSGTERVWPRGKPPKVQWPRPQVTLRLGPAMELASTDHEANAHQVHEGLAEVLASIGDPYALS